jgi:molybdopterin-guanine dinucleotide biosynthesis protein B
MSSVSLSGLGQDDAGQQTIVRLRLAASVSVVKHAHHEFDIDHEGRIHANRQAGASTARRIDASPRSALLVVEADGRPAGCRARRLRLVLVEGFKHAPLPKIEVWRAATGSPLSTRSICS